MDELELMELNADELIELYEMIDTFLLKIDKDISNLEGKKDEK